jgi:exodeoxyribonuclease VII small subunit
MPAKKTQPLQFEDALSRLEEIVRTLEKGDAPLDGALAVFEEGTRLARICTEALDKAEQKVTELIP